MAMPPSGYELRLAFARNDGGEWVLDASFCDVMGSGAVPEERVSAPVRLPGSKGLALEVGYPTGERELRELGGQLFTALFEGPPRLAWRAASEAVRAGRVPRVRTVVEVSERAVAACPWEYLFDPSRSSWVSTTLKAGVVRRRGGSIATELPRPGTQLRVLLVKPGSGLASLGETASELAKAAGQRVSIEELGATTFSELEGRLAGVDVLHYAGLADVSGERVRLLLSERGRVLMDAAELRSRLPPSVRLVVANTAGGASFAWELAAERDAIGMQDLASSDVTKRFAEGLYRALGEGLSLAAAVETGREAIEVGGRTTSLDTGAAWGMPCLYSAAPDRRLLASLAPTGGGLESTANPMRTLADVARQNVEVLEAALQEQPGVEFLIWQLERERVRLGRAGARPPEVS